MTTHTTSNKASSTAACSPATMHIVTTMMVMATYCSFLFVTTVTPGLAAVFVATCSIVIPMGLRVPFFLGLRTVYFPILMALLTFGFWSWTPTVMVFLSTKLPSGMLDPASMPTLVIGLTGAVLTEAIALSLRSKGKTALCASFQTLVYYLIFVMGPQFVH